MMLPKSCAIALLALALPGSPAWPAGSRPTPVFTLVISPKPGTLGLPASPVRLKAQLLDSSGTGTVVAGTWSLANNGSGGTIDVQSGLYVPGKRPGTDTIQVVTAAGQSASINVVLATSWVISGPGSMPLPANPVQLAVMDKGGTRRSVGPGTWRIATNRSGGTINANTGMYAPGSRAGIDTIEFEAGVGVILSADITLASPWVINPSPGTVLVSSAPTRFFADSKGAVSHRYGGVATWTLPSNASGGTINASTGVYAPGSNPGVDTIQFKAADGTGATLNVTVAASIQAGVGLVQAGGQKAAPPRLLAADVTQRASVAKGGTIGYSASVLPGQTYVVSLTGIVGAAQLGVYGDAGFSKPVECLAPRNLSNSTYAQPADCSFVATAGTVYATVTGTSYLATASNSYNIRVSARNNAPPANQGTEQDPMVIQPDKPFAGTTGSDYSYYKVTTAGAGDAVFSMTGLTGTEDLGLNIYDNAKFSGAKLDNAHCYTSEFTTFAESCILPAGQSYYLVIRSASPGGPFTLMVDSPAGAVAPAAASPAAAAPPAAAPNVINQALPASTSAP